jgi:WhiB family redox-sensing transcriptional regulator
VSHAFDALAIHDGGSTFLELLAKPAWHRDAACADHPQELFFPSRGETSAPARLICAGCLVRSECIEAGRSERFGIWGGMSERERRKLRRLPDVA